MPEPTKMKIAVRPRGARSEGKPLVLKIRLGEPSLAMAPMPEKLRHISYWAREAGRCPGYGK